MNQLFASDNGGNSAGLIIGLIVVAVLVFFAFAGLWKTFSKARRAGWMSIIPILNTYVLIRMAGRPRWWILLYIIPLVNVIAHLIVSIDLAKKFGKSAAFGVIGLWLFGYIGYLILGYGDATYKASR